MGLKNLINKKCIFAIPARLESSRLPKKILADICGEPMIKRVLNNIDSIDFVKQNCSIYLCTDSDEVRDLVNKWGYEVIMTSKDCSSGTERIASVLDKLVSKAWEANIELLDYEKKEKILKDTFIFNIQADQPLINNNLIDDCIHEVLNNQNEQIITPVYPLSKDEIHNPNIVKVLISNNNKAIYFSRSAVPHVRSESKDNWHKFFQYWGHVGIYCFRADFLKEWNLLPYSKLENVEKLEQLRFVDAGYGIHTFKTNNATISVDDSSQLNLVREVIKESNLLKKNPTK